jgi:hypothetical protein
MRVRHVGLAALAVVAGASLRPLSTDAVPPVVAEVRNLNFTLPAGAAPESVARPAAGRAMSAWALPGPGRPPRGSRAGWREGPDGTPMVSLWLRVGRRPPRPVLTNAATVEELLGALGVEVDGNDLVRPSWRTPLSPGMGLRVIRVRRALESSLEPVPFRTLIRRSRDLDPGELLVVREGRRGRAVSTYRVVYRNGRVVHRTLVSQVLLTAPVHEVVVEGEPGRASAPHRHVAYGEASWYGFCRVEGMYAAHRTLPFGTRVTVTNLDNGRSVTVVINDRGPFGVPGRIIDLCEPAFAAIAPLEQGVARVRLSW